MQRRDFLRRTAGSAVGLQLSLLLAGCGAAARRDAPSASEAAPPEPNAANAATAPDPRVTDAVEEPWTVTAELARLRRARADAQAAGTPLLLLVLPAEYEQRRAHGQAWAQLALYGTPRAVAQLATCEIACARMAAIRTVFGAEWELPAGVPTALLLTADGRDGRRDARALNVDLRCAYDWGDDDAANAAIDARLARLEAALVDALAPDADAAARRLRAAARARGLAESLDEPALHKALAATVLARLEAAPPSGAAWASNHGCADWVEHPNHRVGFLCGMGHVPARAQRFLYYLIDLES